MKINEEINNEILKARLLELCGNVNIKPTDNKVSSLEYQTTSVNGTKYGIVREGTYYCIKESKASNVLLTESDYKYIGGLENKSTKSKYNYNSYSDALKNLNMVLNTISESYILEEEEELQPEVAPEVQAEPQAPVQDTNSLPDSDITNDTGDALENIDHYLGKLTYDIRNTPEENFSDEKIKGIMNTMISALPLLKISPEDRLELAKRLNKGGNDEEEAPADAGPDMSAEPAPAPEPEIELEPEPEQLKESKIKSLTSLILNELKK